MLTIAMFYFDPVHLIMIAPAAILAMWAQWKVHSAYSQASQIPVASGLTGAEVATMIMQAHGVRDVALEEGHGVLSDHYDPSNKVVRLSPQVFHGRTAAALGIAAHEIGHVMQEKSGYAPLALRNGIVPLAAYGGPFAGLIFIVGMMLNGAQGTPIGQLMIWGGVGLFGVVAIFQLINLPVEFDASRRAKEWLSTSGLVTAEEAPYVRKVLNAAAWTYVAATLMAVLEFAYFLMRAQGSRRE